MRVKIEAKTGLAAERHHEFTDNFNRTEGQWDILATPGRTSAFLAPHGM
jgi:hypothetical protein